MASHFARWQATRKQAWSQVEPTPAAPGRSPPGKQQALVEEQQIRRRGPKTMPQVWRSHETAPAGDQTHVTT